MFINESTNIKDSAIFYAFMREALIEQVGEDEEMVSFIESASDTDIISYAVTGKAAPEEFDKTFYETALMSIIKENVLTNPEMFVESEDYTMANFINEIGTLSDISSMDIIREEVEPDERRNREYINLAQGKDRIAAEKDKIASWEVAKQQGVGEFDGTEKQMAKVAKEQKIENFTNFFKRIQNGITGSEAWGKIKQFATSGTGKTIGVAALVAAASFIAYKAYKNYFSKAAKACAGKSGAEKAACMAKAKQQAQRARIASLRKGASLARNSTNPAKARAALNAKIAAIKK